MSGDFSRPWRWLFDAGGRVRATLLFGLSALGGAALLLGALGRDLSRLWFDTSVPSSALRWLAIALVTPSAALLALGAEPTPGKARATLVATARATLAAAGVLALVDAHACWRAADRHSLHAVAPVTFSLALGVALLLGALVPPRRASAGRVSRARRTFAVALTAFVGTAAWAALEIASVAFTDYRRDADAIVVLGAGVTVDGRPSEALEQRMETACELHRAGHARLVVLSGGHAPGRPSEPDVMKRVALECGIPERDIVLDQGGADTRESANDAALILEGRHLTSALVVSHGYHLARTRMAMEAAGVRAFTVPARERRPLVGKPYYLARELAAWIVYAADIPRAPSDDAGC